jgi:hypothetical protein
MKYLHNREQFLKEQKLLMNSFEDSIFEAVGSSVTYHNNTSWSDSLVGKLFAFAGKKIKRSAQSGVLTKYLYDLEREFRKGQAMAVSKEKVVQQYRVYQNILNIYNFINSKNFNKSEFEVILDNAIKDYKELVKNDKTDAKIKVTAQELLTKLETFKEKYEAESKVQESLLIEANKIIKGKKGQPDFEIVMPEKEKKAKQQTSGAEKERLAKEEGREKPPDEFDLPPLEFNKLTLRKMRSEFETAKKNLKLLTQTPKNLKKRANLEARIKDLIQNIKEREVEIKQMEQEASTKTKEDPSDYEITYTDSAGKTKTEPVANPQNPDDKIVNIIPDENNPDKTSPINVDDIIGIEQISVTQVDDTKILEKIKSLFEDVFSDEDINNYKKEAVISDGEKKKLLDQIKKVADSDDKSFINGIALLKLFNSAEQKYSKTDDKGEPELDNGLFNKWSNGVLSIMDSYSDLLTPTITEFITKMLDPKNFMNKQAQSELLKKYFGLNYTPTYTGSDLDLSGKKGKGEVKENLAYKQVTDFSIDTALNQVFALSGSTTDYNGVGVIDNEASYIFYMLNDTSNGKYYRFIVSKNDTTWLKNISKKIPTKAGSTVTANHEYIVLLKKADAAKLSFKIKSGVELKFTRLKPGAKIVKTKDGLEIQAVDDKQPITSDSFSLKVAKTYKLLNNDQEFKVETPVVHYTKYAAKIAEEQAK